MKKDAPRATDPDEAAGSDDGTRPAAAPGDVSGERREPEEPEEMGGEAPCQLHRFWDVDE